jgi:hypothetical protein
VPEFKKLELAVLEEVTLELLPPKHPIRDSEIKTIISFLKITYKLIKDSRTIYRNREH